MVGNAPTWGKDLMRRVLWVFRLLGVGKVGNVVTRCPSRLHVSSTVAKLYMYKTIWTRLQVSGFGYFSHSRCWQVYKIKHTAMKSPLNKIGSRMALLKRFNFQRVTLIKWHLSNKSVRQISVLLELPRSTVSAVIVEVEMSNNGSAAKW